jgi:acetylornithine deacetylase/succinyl-diaminopimelate desuccinylase-like protein
MKHIDSNRETIVVFMQKIIQFPSVTGNEAEIGAYMANECAADGLDVEIVEPEKARAPHSALRYMMAGSGAEEHRKTR